MKHILLFGAGKSATCLIDYLVKAVNRFNWQFTVAEGDARLALSKTQNAPGTVVAELNIEQDIEQRRALVASADVVISLLPPHLHQLIADDCILQKKHLLTASYLTPEIQQMDAAAREKGLLFLCEMGLDPGIDHMSAMKLVHEIRAKGGTIHAFRSHCGGLVAPESDNNPWHYKISWNPRNVVLAGKAGAVYKENGETKQEPYENLFHAGNRVAIPGLGELCFYPNRDSLGYIPVYHLEEAHTFIRTTLRYRAFMEGWKRIVESGLTREDEWVETDGLNLQQFFARYMSQNEVHACLQQLSPEQRDCFGFSDEKTYINKGQCSLATVLQFVLEEKLKLEPGDKDMIVMLHEIGYRLPGENLNRQVNSSLVVKGEDALRTAMAKTVGLPLGIAAKLILTGVIQETGVHIPVSAAIYEPVLKELEAEGIVFNDQFS